MPGEVGAGAPDAPGAAAPTEAGPTEATALAVRVETMIDFCGSAAAKRADESDDPAPAECVRRARCARARPPPG